jgi:hypothetical protein
MLGRAKTGCVDEREGGLAARGRDNTKWDANTMLAERLIGRSTGAPGA